MLGISLAIICAFTWSTSVILFKKTGDDLHPVLLNLCKNAIAFVLFVPTVLLVEGNFSPPIAGVDIAWLLLSGVIGIGVADAMVLKCLGEIGASRIAIVECAYSPFVIALSIVFLGEALTVPRVLGTLLVLSAILCVSFRKEALERAEGRRLLRGVLWGIAGILAMAGGIVIVKPILDRAPLFWVIGIRMASGTLASVALFLALADRARHVETLRRVERKKLLFFACILSTYVSMMLWVAGYKFNDATLVAVLNQTSTIFTVVLAALFLKERLTPLKVAGTALAIAGVVLITAG